METTKIISLSQLQNLANLVIKAAENVASKAKKIDISDTVINYEDFNEANSEYVETLELVGVFHAAIDKLDAHTKVYVLKRRKHQMYDLLVEMIDSLVKHKDIFDYTLDLNNRSLCDLFVFTDFMKVHKQHITAAVSNYNTQVEYCKVVEYSDATLNKKKRFINSRAY